MINSLLRTNLVCMQSSRLSKISQEVDVQKKAGSLPGGVEDLLQKDLKGGFSLAK